MPSLALKQKPPQSDKSVKHPAPDRTHSEPSHPANSLLQLQRTAGNQAVQQLLQAKTPGLEGSTVSNTAPVSSFDFSRIPTSAGGTNSIQRKAGPVQRQSDGAETANRTGLDLSSVRVHPNSSKPAQVDALVYTKGPDIHLGPGQQQHLPHEGWHAVQQMQGRVTPTIQSKGVSINDNAGLEREAELMGAKAQRATQAKQPSLRLTRPFPTSGLVQRNYDFEDALSYYQNTRSGKRIKYTSGLVEKLYKVAGKDSAALRSQALAEGEIGESFVQLVCASQRFLEVDDDGKIGPLTLAAWDNWKTGGDKGINYGELFKDNKLEIVIAVGEDAYSEVAQIEGFLLARKFAKSGTENNPVYKKKNMYPVQGDRTAPPVQIEIIIEIISEKTTDPKEKFGSFLTDKEITFYSGHARFGTGPDFDAKESTAENFVIGVKSALHKRGRVKKGYDAKMNKILKDRKNDLERLSKAGKFDPDLYQVWFMDACSTLNYMDEFRGGLVKGKNRESLRIFGTNKWIYGDPLPIVKGILDMKTMEEIIQLKQESQNLIREAEGDKPTKNQYFSN